MKTKEGFLFMELKKQKKKTNKTIFNLHTRINVQTFFLLQCRSVHQHRGRGVGSNRNNRRPQRCRSQRQMEASSHTAIKMLLSRLKLVCRMADVHLGRVSVVHLKRSRDSWGRIVKNQNKQKNTEKPLLVSTAKMMKQLK